MILREMTIHECWCAHCSAGQMEQIHDILFKEKTSLAALIGRKITCPNCGDPNTIEDVLSIIPTSFLVSSKNETSKMKSNEELKKWLNVYRR